MSEDLLTVEQVRRRLGCSERTVRRYIKDGVLRVERFGPISKRTKLPCNVRISEMELAFFLRGGSVRRAS